MEQLKNICLKISWSKLEAALNFEESDFCDSRPKTTATGRKSSPVSVGKKHIFRAPSACKSCRTPLKKKANKIYSLQVPGLTTAEARSLYNSKCEDLGIPVLPDQERRFFTYCQRNFQNRNLKLNESGAGLAVARALGQILKTSTYFAYINLSKNMLKDLGTVILCQSLLCSLSVVHLDISSNEITPEGARDIFKTLAGHSSLASIDISSHEGLHRNRLCALGSEAIGNYLKSSKVLTVLNLAGTCIGSEGIDFIVAGLSENQSLSCLNLRNNGLGHKSIEKLAKAIILTDIRELNLSCNKIADEGCEFLALLLSGAYEGYCVVEKLDLSENEIKTEGLGKLLAALRINSQVRHLNLKKNDFSGGLSGNLYQFLSENAVLKYLTLSKCQINCSALEAFAEGLGKNTGLSHLVLSHNQISDRGGNYLSQGLIKNKYLKTLELSNNSIRERGALALAKAVQENNTLTELIMKSNSVKDEGAAKFSEITRWKKNILKLDLELNPCNFKYIDTIKSNLKANSQLHKKMLIPKLYETVDKLLYHGPDFDEIQKKIALKEKERQELDQKIKITGGKIEEIKSAEVVKLNDLKKEYESIREFSIKLSHELEELNFQLNKAKHHGEKITNEMSDKIEALQMLLRDLMQRRSVIKEEIMIKTSKNEETVEEVNKKLYNQQIARKSAEGDVNYLRKKLEEKQNLIENLKNPGRQKLGKVFLASEKLASAKKKSVSPVKSKEDQSNLLNKRVKSLPKKLKRPI